jgi:hypothetical protein
MYGPAMLMRRALPALIALLLLLSPAAVRAEPPNPPGNLEIGSLPNYCRRELQPAVCLNGFIYYLDQARATMGLGPYALPANFLGLSAAQQMFILSNLDRIAYALPPVEGLNAGLDAAAIRGAQEDLDPEPTQSDLGRPWYGYTSNWAGAFTSTLEAYFFWMYADGYESGNIDCKTPTDRGCWGHRQDTLWAIPPEEGRPSPYLYSMGAGTAIDAHGDPSYAMTITGSAASTPPSYYYTWAQAVAEGAGTNDYAVTLPVEEKARLTIAFRGRGTVVAASGPTVDCRHACHRQITEYEPLKLRAIAAPGYRFAGWRGCTARRGSTCTLELLGARTVKVAFVPRHRHRRLAHR